MDPNQPDGYSWTNHTLKYKCWLVLVPTSSLKNMILTELHSSSLVGHSKFHKTYDRAQCSSFWPGMMKDIYTFVSECDIFQHNKGELIRPLGTLHSLPIMAPI